MSWNFRVLAFKQDVSGLPPELAEKYKDHIDFRICEVYYKNNTDNFPKSYAQAQTVTSEDIHGLFYRLNKMKIALEKPILWAGERFPEEYKLNT